MREPSIEEAWAEATEYLYEGGYDALVEAIRALALAVLREAEKAASHRAPPAVTMAQLEQRILALGGEDD